MGVWCGCCGVALVPAGPLAVVVVTVVGDRCVVTVDPAFEIGGLYVYPGPIPVPTWGFIYRLRAPGALWLPTWAALERVGSVIVSSSSAPLSGSMGESVGSAVEVSPSNSQPCCRGLPSHLSNDLLHFGSV